MNIIANTCLGARLYQVNKCMYTNPFMWNIIEANSMIKLIENFMCINFVHITIPISDYYQRRDKFRIAFGKKHQSLPVIYKIVIDNLIDVHYLHYRLDYSCSKPIIRDIDVYYDKIWEYIVDKYMQRIKRMISLHEMPKFVITTAEPSYTVENQYLLIDAINHTPFKMCLITNDLPSNIIGNAKIIHFDIETLENTYYQAMQFNSQIMGF